MRGQRGQRREAFGYAVLDCARIQDGNDHTGTASIVMHVHMRLAVIGSRPVPGGIAFVLVYTAGLPSMIVAVMMVAVMNMARLSMRVGVNDEASERADRSG